MLASRLWAVCTFLLIPDLLWANGEVNREDNRSVQVILGGDKQKAIELEARQAPLRQVIDEIAGKTGTRIRYSVLPEELVTATCAGETVKQVMMCLLGPEADLLFQYSGDAAKGKIEARPIEVRILASTFAEGDPAGCAPDSARCEAGEREEPDTSRMSPAKTDSVRSVPDNIDKLLEMAKAQDPNERANALERLASVEGLDEATLYDELEKALSDEDGEVRAQAVSGLALKRGAGAIDVLKSALHDSDASVRLMAVDGLMTDEQGITLLREALRDSDETVRALAALRLEFGSDVEVAHR
jgi:hypothetical protein